MANVIINNQIGIQLISSERNVVQMECSVPNSTGNAETHAQSEPVLLQKGFVGKLASYVTPVTVGQVATIAVDLEIVQYVKKSSKTIVIPKDLDNLADKTTNCYLVLTLTDKTGMVLDLSNSKSLGKEISEYYLRYSQMTKSVELFLCLNVETLTLDGVKITSLIIGETPKS